MTTQLQFINIIIIIIINYCRPSSTWIFIVQTGVGVELTPNEPS